MAEKTSGGDKQSRPFPMIDCGATVLDGAGFPAAAENVRHAATAIGYTLQAVLLARQQFEGNPEGALDEIEHRVRNLLGAQPSHVRQTAEGETPRTNAVAPHFNLSHGDMRDVAWKLRDLARQLELELAAERHKLSCIAQFDADSITYAEERGRLSATATITEGPFVREARRKVAELLQADSDFLSGLLKELGL